MSTAWYGISADKLEVDKVGRAHVPGEGSNYMACSMAQTGKKEVGQLSFFPWSQGERLVRRGAWMLRLGNFALCLELSAAST